MQDRAEVTVYDNFQLKDQWEKRAKLLSDKENQEKERKEKSAINGLFKQWQYRMAVRTGTVAVSEKKVKGSDMSDFRKYVVKASGEEVDMALLEAKFKVKPPPKKPAAPPPSPPPKKKPPPPPRKERPPKPVEKKPEPPKKPVLKPVEKPPQPIKDNLSRWGESWKMLKSPLRQQRSVESKPESVAPRQTNDKTYKSQGYNFDKQWGSEAEWKESWKQLKNHSDEVSMENMSFFEIISQGKWWRTYEEIETFSLPVWAGTWKTVNFKLGQTPEDWDQKWPQYKREPSDKLLKAQFMEDTVSLPGWEDCWKTAKPDVKQETEKTKLQIPNVFLPGWNDSWKTCDMGVKHNDQAPPSMRDWRDSWNYCQEHKWCSASMDSRYRHYAMMMAKRRLTNELRGGLLDEEIPSEWMESWKSPQCQSQTEESDESGAVSEQDMSDVPLHLQFHKINTPFPSWNESWKVSSAPTAGDDEQQSSTDWKDSWKISNPNMSSDSQSHGDVVFLSREHKTHRYMGVEHAEDAMGQDEWSECWKTTKPEPQQEHEEENAPDRNDDLSKHSPVVIDIPLYDWTESWRLSTPFKPCNSNSLARWKESWRLSNLNHAEQLDQGVESRFYRQNGPKHHQHLCEVELPQAEWSNSWKYLKSDTLDPNMSREDSEEWGQSWRVLNPQLYLKKEAWCDQATPEPFADLRLQFTFLSREDRMVLKPEFSPSEWSESWRFLKQEADTRSK
ncbi:uncharacterized protein [Osmerus mordax]|uniref:uncharacterized protein n=1 Tax=Osmerus mordax TaxID=8014 RepID=UPI00350EF165